jgi:hypothetical protein
VLSRTVSLPNSSLPKDCSEYEWQTGSFNGTGITSAQTVIPHHSRVGADVAVRVICGVIER